MVYLIVFGALECLALVGLILYGRKVAARAAAPSAETASPKAETGAIAATTLQPLSTSEVAESEIASRTQQLKRQEIDLAKSLQSLKDMMVQLNTSLEATDNASVEATAQFRSVAERLPAAGSSQLIQPILVEIARLVQANASFRSNLETTRRDLDEQRTVVEKLRAVTRIDALTQIANRAGFDERLEEALGRLRRYEEGFCLAILDIDHFKRINDTYGHVQGDRVLKGVASKIRASLRGTDFVARYGGEEFAVILPRSPCGAAFRVVDNVRDLMAAAKFNLDGEYLRVTLSAGVAQARAEDTPDAIVARADASLYHAKQSGRNRVLSADLPDADGAAAGC